MSAPREVVAVAAQALREAGVEVAWGMPGGDSLPLVRALVDEGIRFVLVRDEASAGFAADASAQLSGAPGLCVATLGPGLVNLLGGVAGATLERSPVLAFTSRYRTDRRGLYTHMMLDQTPLMAATGKAVVRLTAAHAAGELRHALAVAQAPRPGAVWVEIPTEVASATTNAGPLAPPPAPCPAGVDPAVVARVRRWKRPVILVGYAARAAGVAALAEALQAPVLTTYKAKGAVPEGKGWALGAAGLSPVADRVHQALLAEADGLLLLGWDPAELRDHWLPGWSEAAEVVVVDTHAPTDLPTRIDALHVGDLAAAVGALVGQGASTWRPAEAAAHRERHDAVFAETTFGPASLVRAVQEAVDAVPGAVATLDVGAHRITASHVWRCAVPDTLLQSNGWSSMGYGLPAALAARAHGRPAVALTGDMGLQMVLGELGTLAELGGPLVVVVFLDHSLSLIELKQERLGHPTAGVRFTDPDLPALAAAFGLEGCEVSDATSLTAAVSEGLQRKVPTLVGVRFDAAPYRLQM